MQCCNSSESDTKSVATHKDNQIEELLKVRLNKDDVFVVNKEKMLEKSHYFNSITKSCFADHKSEFTDVCIPTSADDFKQVIDYVSTDTINLTNDNIFEIFQVADYLQIESLSQVCFDFFIHNLNSKTVDQQLSLMENYPLLCNDFKEKALKFKKSGRPSVKGLYVSEFDYSINGRYCFKLVTDGPDYVFDFQTLCRNDFLHFFRDSIIVQTFGSLKPRLLECGLVTGKFLYIEFEYNT